MTSDTEEKIKKTKKKHSSTIDINTERVTLCNIYDYEIFTWCLLK